MELALGVSPPLFLFLFFTPSLHPYNPPPPLLHPFPPSLPPPLSPSARFHDGGKLTLIIVSLAGFVIFDVVYVAAVMNYMAQSEMVIDLLRSIKGMIEENTYGNARRGGVGGMGAGDIQGPTPPLSSLDRAVRV